MEKNLSFLEARHAPDLMKMLLKKDNYQKILSIFMKEIY